MGNVAWGIIVASGKEEQITSEADTAFLSLGSKPVLVYSLLAFEQCPEVEGVVIASRKERMEDVLGLVHMFGCTKVKKIVAGSTARKTTVQSALKALDEDVSIVVIHEASRPCVSSALIAETIGAAKKSGCGVAAARITDRVKQVERGQKVSATVDSGKLWAVHSPQTFKRELLEKALAESAKMKAAPGDESEAVERAGKPVTLVPSPPSNIRILAGEDLALATTLVTQAD